MPAHIKAMLTAVNLSIPISKRALVLGTWQGVFLWEHRRATKKKANSIECCGSLTRLLLLLANVIHPAFMTLGIQYHTRKIV